MPARALPERPDFTTESEREVWERLVKGLRPEDVVLSNVRLTDERQDYEIDLLALLPGAGFVAVEVKGGSVFVEDGQWRQKRRGDTIAIHPVDQSRKALYALRRYVEADPRWNGSRTRVRWGHTVVAPYSSFDPDFCLPDCPRWAVHGREDQLDLPGRIWDIPAAQESGYRVPTEADAALVVDILRGRSLPAYSLVADSEERASAADRLTAEQATLLKVTRLLNRVEVRGGAGSGKTILALTQAKDLTRGMGQRRPQRVALVCYSIGLARYFKRELARADRRHRPAFVGTFEDLGRLWGARIDGDRTDSDFWENRLPARMAELAEELPDGRKFDAIIVDEAQDFADLWWRPLMKALRDEESGGLFVYTDENQRVFARFGRPPVPLVPLVLDHNLRNTRQIAEAFSPLAPMRVHARGGEGPDVRFVPCAPSEALDRADDEVEALLEEGWEPRHVMLITTGARHPQQVDLQESLGQDGYWESFWDDEQVFYGHVLGCKGLERRAVVLCVNESQPRERARERLYVGLSRPTDQLVFVGDPILIREMGGDRVAKRLGI